MNLMKAAKQGQIKDEMKAVEEAEKCKNKKS